MTKVAHKTGTRFRSFVKAARASLLADARKHEVAQRAEEKRIKAAKRTEEKRTAEAAARAEALRLAKISVRNDAVDILLTFLRDLRSQSRHIRVDGDHERESKNVVMTVSYQSSSNQEIEIVQRSHFLVADTATESHVGVVLKPRKVFKSVERLGHYLAEYFLREVARSVALAEAAKESGISIGANKVRQGSSGRIESTASERSKAVERAAYREGSLKKLRSLERVVGLKVSKASGRGSR